MGDGLNRLTASGAAVAAVVGAVASGRLPRWLRVTLVLGLCVLAAGAGLSAYRYVTRPVTLTVAAGSLEGDAPRYIGAIAARLATTSSSVRLKLVEKGTLTEATKAFSAKEADLAVVRADVGDLSDARTVVQLTHAVVLLVAAPGSGIEDMDGLKGHTVGVIGAEVNRQAVAAISREYDLDRAKVHFRDLGLKDVAPALKAKQVQALLVVMPLSERYLTMLRDLFPGSPKLKLGLVPLDAAGAIAAISKAYESYEVPKGILRGSPPIPDDDVTTLKVPFFLVAHKDLGKDRINDLTRAVMETRRDLTAEYPLLAQISSPSTDKDAYVPIHPGAAAYFNGDQQSFFDRYGDQIFYGSMLFGSLTSLFAAAWRYMAGRPDDVTQRPLTRLYGLSETIRTADESRLSEVESTIDDLLRTELDRLADAEDGDDGALLALAAQRLQYLIVQRRATLATPPVRAN